jgi:hypothetical protein
MKEYLTPEDYEIAKSNGISREVAYKRFYELHMSREDAISKAIGTRRRSKYTDEIIELAKSNGVSYRLFTTRVREGWSWLQAATDPPKRRKRTNEELLEYYRNRVNELESKSG